MVQSNGTLGICIFLLGFEVFFYLDWVRVPYARYGTSLFKDICVFRVVKWPRFANQAKSDIYLDLLLCYILD